MKRYKYASLLWEDSIFYFGCTDAEITEWVHSKIKTFEPKRRISSHKDPYDEKYGLTVEKVKAQGLFWWTLRQLCQKGWEPFSAEWGDLHLRFEVETVE